MADPAKHLSPNGYPAPAQPGQGRADTLASPEVISGTTKLIDFCLVLAAAAGTFAFYLVAVVNDATGSDRYTLTAFVGATIFITGFQRIGGYDFKRLSLFRWQVTRVILVWAGAVSVLLSIAFLTKVSGAYSRGWAISWVTVSLGLLLIERSVLHLTINRWVRQGYLVRKIVIVGAGEAGEQLITKLRKSQDASISIVGVFDDRKTRIAPSICGLDVLGTTDDLILFARQMAIDEVIVALPLSAEQRLRTLFDKLRLLPVDLRLSAEPVADAFPIRGISYVGNVPMLEVVERPLKHWNAVAKWVEDKVLGVALFMLLAPAMAIISLLIKLDSPGPVFFVQDRFGFNNNVIRVLKFRTMYVAKGDPSGAERTVRNDPRVTRLGRILRATSLDELPQLINVLRGDMSLVGPRPHAVSMRTGGRFYYETVKEYLNRHRVRPGITGWAQVNGLRGEIDTLAKAHQRVACDLDYIEQWSIWLDLKILAMSFRTVITRDNAF